MNTPLCGHRAGDERIAIRGSLGSDLVSCTSVLFWQRSLQTFAVHRARSDLVEGQSCKKQDLTPRPEAAPEGDHAPFSIRAIATIVFQLRVVTGTPNSFSSCPRYPMARMLRR